MKESSNLFGKRMVLAVLLCLLALPLFAGGGRQAASAGAGGLPDLNTSTPVEVIMYYTGDKPARQDELWNNINRLARAKINTTLKINMLPSADYRQRYPLLFASGEVFDLAYAATWLDFAQLAQRGAYKELEQLAPKYAPKLHARQSATAIKQATVNGHLYGLPSLYATYSAYGPVYRADVVTGWDGRMQNFADLERYLGLVKAQRPEMEPIQVASLGSELDDLFLFSNGIYAIKGSTNDFLFIDPAQANPKLFTYYEWNKTPEFLSMMERWNNAGYFSKSGLADTDNFKMRDGKAAAYTHNIDTWEGYFRSNAGKGWDIKWSNFVSDLSNMAFTQDTCVVAATSKNPDRALALYDLIMSDEELFRAFVYGIEGVTYNIREQGGQKYVEQIPGLAGVLEFTRMWCARTPEFYLPGWGAPPDLIPTKRGFDAVIKDGVGAQKYRSFVLDISAVETEYANCVNAHQQYWWPLELAYVDVRTGLAEYERQMKAAGIERVKQVIQQQLDKYISEL
jgi:putative aldouronate transport system substrate-binding protein